MDKKSKSLINNVNKLRERSIILGAALFVYTETYKTL